MFFSNKEPVKWFKEELKKEERTGKFIADN